MQMLDKAHAARAIEPLSERLMIETVRRPFLAESRTFCGGHTLPESQINELPFENFL